MNWTGIYWQLVKRYCQTSKLTLIHIWWVWLSCAHSIWSATNCLPHATVANISLHIKQKCIIASKVHIDWMHAAQLTNQAWMHHHFCPVQRKPNGCNSSHFFELKFGECAAIWRKKKKRKKKTFDQSIQSMANNEKQPHPILMDYSARTQLITFNEVQHNIYTKCNNFWHENNWKRLVNRMPFILVHNAFRISTANLSGMECLAFVLNFVCLFVCYSSRFMRFACIELCKQ